MIEQEAEPTSGEPGFVGPAAPHSSNAQGEPVAAMQGSMEASMPGLMPASIGVDSPKLVPEQGAGEMSQADPLKAFLEKADAGKADASKADASKPDASNAADQKAEIPRIGASPT